MKKLQCVHESTSLTDLPMCWFLAKKINFSLHVITLIIEEVSLSKLLYPCFINSPPPCEILPTYLILLFLWTCSSL